MVWVSAGCLFQVRVYRILPLQIAEQLVTVLSELYAVVFTFERSLAWHLLKFIDNFYNTNEKLRFAQFLGANIHDNQLDSPAILRVSFGKIHQWLQLH